MLNDAELAKRLDMLRAKGVVQFSLHPDGELATAVFGAVPGPVSAPAKEEEPAPHPADLVANPPPLGTVDEEAA